MTRRSGQRQRGSRRLNQAVTAASAACRQRDSDGTRRWHCQTRCPAGTVTPQCPTGMAHPSVTWYCHIPVSPVPMGTEQDFLTAQGFYSAGETPTPVLSQPMVPALWNHGIITPLICSHFPARPRASQLPGQQHPAPTPHSGALCPLQGPASAEGATSSPSPAGTARKGCSKPHPHPHHPKDRSCCYSTFPANI